MPDPVTGWQVFTWAWDKKDEVGRLLAGVYRWFRGEGRPDGRGVLILGPGGTGKKTVARILSGRFDWLTDDPWRYDESIGVERYPLADDPAVEVVVSPGQELRRRQTWHDLLADVTAGKYRGVVLVAGYGYHDLATASYKRHHLYAGRKGDFVRAYTAEKRGEELAVLRHLAPHLVAAPGPVWLLTVVTKQDLWWKSRANVERHYLTGEHSQLVAEVAARREGRPFRHETAFGSLVICNFHTGEGEPLAKTVAGYDHGAQVGSVRRLLEMVAALKTWEERP